MIQSQGSDVFSVDTIQIAGAGKAFTGGTLDMPTVASSVTPAMTTWNHDIINCILICVTALLFILSIRRFLGILPYLTGGLLRWKEVVNLEASVRNTRDRNALFVISIPAFCLIVSRYDIYSLEFAKNLMPGLKTLIIIGVFAAYMMVRGFFILIAAPKKFSREVYGLSNRAHYNYFIVLTALMLLTVGILAICKVNDLTIKTIAIYEIALFFVIFGIRKVQILSNSCNHFTAFLYLCSLELLPAALVIASAVLF